MLLLHLILNAQIYQPISVLIHNTYNYQADQNFDIIY